MENGDKVRILSTESTFLEQYVGTVGVIASHVRNVFEVEVSGGNLDNIIWAFSEIQLEKI